MLGVHFPFVLSIQLRLSITQLMKIRLFVGVPITQHKAKDSSPHYLIGIFSAFPAFYLLIRFPLWGLNELNGIPNSVKNKCSGWAYQPGLVENALASCTIYWEMHLALRETEAHNQAWHVDSGAVC